MTHPSSDTRELMAHFLAAEVPPATEADLDRLFTRINAQLAEITRILTEHTRLLERLPEAVCKALTEPEEHTP